MMENKPWVEALADGCPPGPVEVTVPAMFTWERKFKEELQRCQT